MLLGGQAHLFTPFTPQKIALILKVSATFTANPALTLRINVFSRPFGSGSHFHFPFLPLYGKI